MYNANDLPALFVAISLYGDEKAFDCLFRSQYERLYRFALQYVHSHEQAEEVVNDVFVKLWRYRASLHNVGNPESYLFIAVKNQSLNYVKRYSHLRISLNSEGNLSSLVSGSTPQQDVEWKELFHKLNTVVDALPEQCRKIFKLVKEEGMKPQQVAQILNLSVRTVETQLYRATKRLEETVVQHRRKRRSGGSGKALFVLLVAFLQVLR